MSFGKPVVCFDIGGVLVQIRHSWGAAMNAVGLPAAERLNVHLNDCPSFLTYQDGAIGDLEYASELGAWLGLDPENAVLVHRAILDQDYPDALSLVTEIQSNGVYTSCFSNTNALHWERLCSPEFHPAVAQLDLKLASHILNRAKPLPAAFHSVEAQFPPHDLVIFFDDSAVNVAAAKDCGWVAFQVDPNANPIAQMRVHLSELGVIS